MIFNRDQQEVTRIAGQIRLLLLDVDGVLTDGSLYYGTRGEELKVFNTLDGHGIKLARKHGIDIGIISGRDSEPLTRRTEDLGIRILLTGREDKGIALAEIISQQGIDNSVIAFAGDDLPDLEVMAQVALGISVPNGHREVTTAADMVTDTPGGKGAVREICDFLIKARNSG